MTIVTMTIFFLEIILQTIADRNEDEPERTRYFGSFYFWLDLISTLSLLLDITWLMDYILNISSSDSGVPTSMGTISRTSRGVRIGSRAGRIARITRIFRAERIISFYKRTRSNFANVNNNTYGDTIMAESQNANHNINGNGVD